jgi:hypothetical protein
MSHEIQAFVGPIASLLRFCGASPNVRLFVAQSGQTLATAPIASEDFEFIDASCCGGPGWADGRITISESDRERLARASQGGALAYVETNYFGVAGYQAAALWRDGELAFGPLTARAPDADRVQPINRASRELGVVATGGHNEFDSFGFGGVRSNRDIVEHWIEVGPPTPRAPKG